VKRSSADLTGQVSEVEGRRREQPRFNDLVFFVHLNVSEGHICILMIINTTTLLSKI
jgi:hypothetical protein